MRDEWEDEGGTLKRVLVKYKRKRAVALTESLPSSPKLRAQSCENYGTVTHVKSTLRNAMQRNACKIRKHERTYPDLFQFVINSPETTLFNT